MVAHVRPRLMLVVALDLGLTMQWEHASRPAAMVIVKKNFLTHVNDSYSWSIVSILIGHFNIFFIVDHLTAGDETFLNFVL